MNKLQNTAKKLDTVFHVLNIFLSIAFVALIVCLALIAAAFIFKLDPYMIGSGYNSLSFGNLDLTIAQAYAPNPKLVLVLVAIQSVLALVICVITRLSVNCIRNILAPMKMGEPFHSAVSSNLKKLGKFILVLGISTHCIEAFTTGLFVGGFDLEGLLIGEKITGITYNSTFDMTFLVFAAMMFLLSYVFQYGEELQQLSDETL